MKTYLKEPKTFEWAGGTHLVLIRGWDTTEGVIIYDVVSKEPFPERLLSEELRNVFWPHWFTEGGEISLAAFTPFLNLIPAFWHEELHIAEKNARSKEDEWLDDSDYEYEDEEDQEEDDEEEIDEIEEMYDDLSDDDQMLVDFLLEDGGYNDKEDAIFAVRQGELTVYGSKQEYIDEFVENVFGQLDSRKRSYIDDDQIWHDLECGGGMNELSGGRVVLW